MATKIHHYQELPGTKELYALLNIINDADKYNAVLAELENKRLEVNKSLAQLELGKEIDDLHKKALADRKEAQDQLEFAMNQADEIIKNAKKDADSIKHKIQEEKKDLTQKKNKFEDHKVAVLSMLEEREEHLKNKAKELNQQAATLNLKAEELIKQELEIKTKYETLESALKTIK